MPVSPTPSIPEMMVVTLVDDGYGPGAALQSDGYSSKLPSMTFVHLNIASSPINPSITWEFPKWAVES